MSADEMTKGRLWGLIARADREAYTMLKFYVQSTGTPMQKVIAEAVKQYLKPKIREIIEQIQGVVNNV